MSEFLCKNCRLPMKAKWDEELGYVSEHYDSPDCHEPEFDDEDSSLLDNDYSD